MLQQLRRNRLRQHLVAAAANARQLVGADGVTRDEDHGDVVVEPVGDREPVLSGQADVENREPRRLLREAVEGLFGARGGDHAVSLVLELRDEKLTDTRVVLDHEDGPRGLASGGGRRHPNVPKHRRGENPRGMVLHVHEWGARDSDVVVCIHGLRGHGAIFRDLAERLADRFRVLAPDLRGHGRSDWDPPWNLETHVADLRETVERYGPATFVGHSFGARLAMELLVDAPSLVRRAVLLDPIVWAPPPMAFERAEGERADRVFESVEEAIDERVVSSRLFSTPRAVLEREMADHLVATDGGFRYRYCPSAVIAGFGELSRTPPEQSSLRVPTLLVRGAESDVVPTLAVEWYGEIGPLLETYEVRAGHHLLWDAFDDTAAAVERFLS